MSLFRRPSRRAFLKGLGAAALAAPFVTSQLLAHPPSRRVRHASFGAGGMAWADLTQHLLRRYRQGWEVKGL